VDTADGKKVVVYCYVHVQCVVSRRDGLQLTCMAPISKVDEKGIVFQSASISGSLGDNLYCLKVLMKC
jgi:hypothetical protein